MQTVKGYDHDQVFSCTCSTWCLFDCMSKIDMETEGGSFDRCWTQHPWLRPRMLQRNPQTFAV
jgi:hypothetical protein